MIVDRINCGPISESEREHVAKVIDSAFAAQLRGLLPDRTQRLGVLISGLDPRAAIGAYFHDVLVGVVGLRTASTSVFDRMTFGMLRKELGMGAVKARMALRVLDRPLEPGSIRIEFLAVEESARGKGVGSALLRAVERRACAESARLMELYVEAANDDAHRLYVRDGYCEDPTYRDRAPRR